MFLPTKSSSVGIVLGGLYQWKRGVYKWKTSVSIDPVVCSELISPFKLNKAFTLDIKYLFIISFGTNKTNDVIYDIL